MSKKEKQMYEKQPKQTQTFVQFKTITVYWRKREWQFIVWILALSLFVS